MRPCVSGSPFLSLGKSFSLSSGVLHIILTLLYHNYEIVSHNYMIYHNSDLVSHKNDNYYVILSQNYSNRTEPSLLLFVTPVLFPTMTSQSIIVL